MLVRKSDKWVETEVVESDICNDGKSEPTVRKYVVKTVARESNNLDPTPLTDDQLEAVIGGTGDPVIPDSETILNGEI